VVERLLLLADTQVDEGTVRLALPVVEQTPTKHGSLAACVETFERETICSELERNQYNMTGTARALGLERSHLYKKCGQLGIDIDRLRRSEM
jgi:DNA-binding NtrC family response regulator